MKNPACKKCKGLGYIPQFAGIEGGRCFACNDSRRPSDLEHLAAVRAEEARFAGMTSAERNALVLAEAQAASAARQAERRAARAARRADAAL